MIVYTPYSDTLTRAYSDKNVLIERDGIRYIEAIDPTVLNRKYSETNIPIAEEPDPDEEEATSVDYQQALAELGVEG